MARLKGSCKNFVLAVFLYGILCEFPLSQAETQSPSMSNAPLFDIPNANTDFFTQTKVEIPLTYDIRFFGSKYSKLYISADGFIGFVDGIQYQETKWIEGVRNPSTDLPFMAPYYFKSFPQSKPKNYQGQVSYKAFVRDQKYDGDIDDKLKEELNLLNYLSEYIPQAGINVPQKDFSADIVVMVTWENVAAEPNKTYQDNFEPGNWCTKDAPCEDATFQAVLVHSLRYARTFAIFNYQKMGIKTADKMEFFQAGFNGGYSRGWYNVIPCHGLCSYTMDQTALSRLPSIAGSDVKGRYILEVGREIIVRGGCLPDELRAGMLEVFPTNVGMHGGERLEVSGHCSEKGHDFYCKFGSMPDDPVTKGVMINSMKGYCEVPQLTQIDALNVSWSRDGKDWTAMNREINVLLPSRLHSPSIDFGPEVLDKSASKINVQWDSKIFSESSGANVEFNLIGYRELDDEGKVEFKVLEKLGEVQNEVGKFAIDVETHRCKEDCKKFEEGFIEVRLQSDFLATATERVAVRYGVIPIGWYVDAALTDSMGSDWSNQMCQDWYDKDSKQEEWIERLLPCPCNLGQALADFGRWQPDPGCSIYSGSECHYHKGAKHCVRSVVPTVDGSGNQCCYNNNSNLVYSQLSYQGSTPDRSHSWGTPPYRRPNLVPSLSHWKHDVIPFYYCCLWNDYEKCDLYMKQRSTRDCQNYVPPGLAFLRGDTHITTFDNQTYQFGGSKDYILLKTKDLEIQGRFSPPAQSWDLGTKSGSSSWKPPALTSIAVRGSDEIVEMHPAPESAEPRRALDVRVGDKGDRKFFIDEEDGWKNFKDLSIVNSISPSHYTEHSDFLILTFSNIGIRIQERNGLVHVLVALPASMMTGEKEGGMGLFGKFDGDSGNDFMSRDGDITSPGVADKSKIFTDFASTWGVLKEEESIFPYHEAPGTTAPKYVVYDDIPRGFTDAPTLDQISAECGDDQMCRWDYRITGSIAVARETRDANRLFTERKTSAVRVENCGLPGIGMMANVTSNDFSVGSNVSVVGCDAKHEFHGEASFRCVEETMEEAEAAGRSDYGHRRTRPDGTKYIVHWVPKPHIVCAEAASGADDDDDGLSTWAIIGIIVAAVVFLSVLLIIILLLIRRRRSHRGSDIGEIEMKNEWGSKTDG